MNLDKLYCALWTATIGVTVGVGLYAGLGEAAWWAVPPLLVAGLVAGIFAGRVRPKIAPPSGAIVLPMLSPLAREVLEGLPDPLMLVDAGGKVLFANLAMRDVIGAVGEVERKPVSSLLRMPSVFEALTHTSATGEPTETAFTIRVPVERHFQAYTAKVGGRHDGNASPAVALLLHDLTALRRAEQTRVDFVANASHELRTPLAAVSGFIETLKGPARDDAEARDKFLDIMRIEAERMRRLIDDLLSLTRIELNEHVTPRGETSLCDLVQEAVAALSPLAEAEDIAVTVTAEPNLPKVIGERDELIQVMQNLLHNAIKYGREHGKVDIVLTSMPGAGRNKTDTMVAVAIRDDGEGIPQEAIPRLTERFYRVDVKRSREKGGTGLGLAIVKHIVNRHGGKLQVESRIGDGSTFTVTLPAVRQSTDMTRKIDKETTVTEVL